MRSVLDNALLNIMYKGTTTIQDFQWDTMTTVPILSLVSADDINYIKKLITSPRYSGNNKLKMEKIDELMHFRGFTKFAGGTNRLVYTHPSAPNAVFKVAIDSVGINDNPAEFRNQKFLKPYCCKVFECSPCGTIASFEKVDRITTFEEFYTIADDYFYLLSRKILGKYVMEDIGIDYFMNIGIRRGFGVVILDFPYLFELDGAKLKCANQLDDGTICGGEIDYDHGFNKLVCSKCGRIYRARDLSKPPESGGLIIYGKGRRHMHITITEGDKVIKEVTTGVERDHLEKPTMKTGAALKKQRSKIVVTITDGGKPVDLSTPAKVEEKKVETPKVVTGAAAYEPVNVTLNYGRKRTVLSDVNKTTAPKHSIKVTITDAASESVDDSDVKEYIPNHTDAGKEEVEETKVEQNLVDECINEVSSNDCGTSSLEDTPIPVEQMPGFFTMPKSEIEKMEKLMSSEEDTQIPTERMSGFFTMPKAEINTEESEEEDTEESDEEEAAESEESSSAPESREVEETSEEEEGGLEDIVFVRKVPEEPEDNVAYCVPLIEGVDLSVYENGVDDLALVPSELFAIYLKTGDKLTRYTMNNQGDLDPYEDEVEDQMKDLKDFDISPLMEKTVDDKDAVVIDGDHFDEEEDAVIAQMKSSSKKVSLDSEE